MRVREMCGGKKSLKKRVEQTQLLWSGHMERMGAERMEKNIYKLEVEVVMGRGKPRMRWRDEVR